VANATFKSSQREYSIARDVEFHYIRAFAENTDIPEIARRDRKPLNTLQIIFLAGVQHLLLVQRHIGNPTPIVALA